MFQFTRVMLRAFALSTCFALTLPAAGPWADDQSDRAEQERIVAEERQRKIDADQDRQRQQAEEWARQQEAERCAAEERQRKLDAERARQQQLNDEWSQRQAELARQTAGRG